MNENCQFNKFSDDQRKTALDIVCKWEPKLECEVGFIAILLLYNDCLRICKNITDLNKLLDVKPNYFNIDLNYHRKENNGIWKSIEYLYSVKNW